MKIGIFGTGAFGLALSSLIVNNASNITMWTKFSDEKELLENNRSNEKLLPGYILNSNIKITTSIEECSKDKDLLIIALPSLYITNLLKELSNFIDKQNILIVSKGFTDENKLISSAIKEYLLTDKYAVLSGPNFAIDIVKKAPLAFTIAVTPNFDSNVLDVFKTNYSKIKYSNNIIGVELQGILKNIYAIISGILDGVGSLPSTKAFYIVDALSEMKEIIKSFNNNDIDMLTYAGLGDFILTATSTTSRNYTYGLLLSNQDINKSIEYLNNNTVEGYNSMKAISSIIDIEKYELLNTLNNIINKECDSKKIIDILLK